MQLKVLTLDIKDFFPLGLYSSTSVRAYLARVSHFVAYAVNLD